MIEYCIVGEEYPQDLAVKVNKHIEDDWIPIGGVSHTGESYIQAMSRLKVVAVVKKPPPPKPQKKAKKKVAGEPKL